MAFLVSLCLLSSISFGARIKRGDDETTFLPVEPGEQLSTTTVNSGTIYMLDESTQAVIDEVQSYRDGGEDVQLTNLLEIRTKLKFVGNAVELRNPEKIDQLVQDISEQQN